ncbi:hypothetical protein CKO35_15385 [Ectothiorhodospira shaposhnikovii]|uniref:NifX-associated nitrogen fixation protein n=1 Tax=Ectothiorhodospira shaposhnikovii TaxID=1054 RepID=UPI001903126B|nr:NifX-associated nitrogen fixation protein [Ectothiorhodospira shaposhnikovii]MBK1674647.1 hypothetical protein [Ectothiorhodospira shaposhnikovii]
MSNTTADPILETDFMKEMVRQMRALDTFGTRDGQSDEALLSQFVISPEKRKEIPLVADMDRATLARVNAFYNAVAVLIEKECGRMATVMLSLNGEGFGRVIISVGKLLVVDKTLRDVHRFGFDSLSKMKTEADKLLSVALNIVGDHPDVAGM